MKFKIQDGDGNGIGTFRPFGQIMGEEMRSRRERASESIVISNSFGSYEKCDRGVFFIVSDTDKGPFFVFFTLIEVWV